MNLNQQLGVATLRLILGLIFLMQGFGKVFKFGVDQVYANFFKNAYADILPDVLLKITTYYTSYVELIAGTLLLIGIFRNFALYALASVLVIVSFGHGLLEPIWDVSHVLYRTILLVALLLLPEKWDRFTIDRLITKKNS